MIHLLLISFSLIIRINSFSKLIENSNIYLDDSLITTNKFQANSFIIRKTELDFFDYRNSSNFFTFLPFGFFRDLGWIGQPSEILIYGMGYNQTSFLKDYININNRLFNSFDANLFQSESIDSLEIISLPKGFIYNNQNNPVAVNFFSKEFSTSKPYTRIKYYQAPNEEGMVDGIFSSNFGKKFSFYSEITNQSADPFYRNSDYSLWMGKIKTLYKFSNNLTIFSSYFYTKSLVQLFGGVNKDSILIAYPSEQLENVLYDNILAPVKYYYRYQKNTNHSFDLGFKNIYKNFTTNFSFYFQTELKEFRQNDTTNKNFQSNAENIFHNNKHETLGLQLKDDFSYSFFQLNFIGIYERNKFYSPLINKKSLHTFSAGFVLSLLLPEKIGQLSTFGKYLNYENKTHTGFGGELLFNISKNFKIYSGVSSFQKPFSMIESSIFQDLLQNKISYKLIEIKTYFSNSFAKAEFGYFYSSSKNKPTAAIMQKSPLLNDEAYYFKTDNIYLTGINLLLNIHLYKILLYSNSSYYFSKRDREISGLPEFTFSGGIYYIDSLFNSNLHLKAGLNFYAIGKRNSVFYDFEKNISSPYKWYISPNIRSVPFIPDEVFSSEFQTDIFIAGQIKKRAIIYFVLENLLDRNYFVIPYYPKQERGFRFGVAWEFFD